MTGNSVSVSISGSTAETIRKRIKGTGFGSVDEYVEFVLMAALGEGSQETDKGVMEKRLNSLGYF